MSAAPRNVGQRCGTTTPLTRSAKPKRRYWRALPDGALMRRAANGLATAIARELVLRTGGIAGRSVCAVVGSGDNGGDALWAVTFLRRRGAAASAVLLNPERTHQKALAAFRKAGGRVVQSVPAATDLVIDGVVGISGSGPLRPAAAEVFAAVDAAGIPVVSVDIPSGVDVQTGAVSGPAVHPALTVTFGGLKPVHALGDCGRVELVDIGLDLRADRHDEFRRGRRRRPLARAGTEGRQVHAGCHRHPGRLGDLSGCGRAVHRRRGGRHLRHGALRGKCCTASAFALARGHRRAERRRDGPGAGLGRRSRDWAPTTPERPRCGSRSTPTCR